FSLKCGFCTRQTLRARNVNIPPLSPFAPNPLPRSVLFLGLHHDLLEECLELRADVPGLALELTQELPLLILDLTVGEDHLPQPAGLPGADPAVGQDVILDGLIEEFLEGRRGVLHALVQLDKEVG